MNRARLLSLPAFFLLIACGKKPLVFDLSVPSDLRHQELSDRVVRVRAQADDGFFLERSFSQGWSAQKQPWRIEQDVPRDKSWDFTAFDEYGVRLMSGHGVEDEESSVVRVELREVIP